MEETSTTAVKCVRLKVENVVVRKQNKKGCENEIEKKRKVDISDEKTVKGTKPKKKKKPNLLYRSDVKEIETMYKFSKKFMIPFDKQEYTHKLQLQRLKNISKWELQYPSMSKSTRKELVRKRIKAFEKKVAFDEDAYIRGRLEPGTQDEPCEFEDPEDSLRKPCPSLIPKVIRKSGNGTPRHCKNVLKNGTTERGDTTDVVHQRGANYTLRLLKTMRNRSIGISEEQLCRLDSAIDEVQAIVFLMGQYVKQVRAHRTKENRYRLLVRWLPHPVSRRAIKDYFTGSGYVPTKLKYLGPTDLGQAFLDYDSSEGLQFGLLRNSTVFGGNTIHVAEVGSKTDPGD